MFFLESMYLQAFDIHCCRCSFSSGCICRALIFAVVDALLGSKASATCFSLNLQMLFSLPGMYNCIYILPFLGFEDASFANFASSTCSFHDLQILLIKIWHPQFPHIHYRRYPLSSLTSWTDPIHDLPKIDIRNSSKNSYINFL